MHHSLRTGLEQFFKPAEQVDAPTPAETPTLAQVLKANPTGVNQYTKGKGGAAATGAKAGGKLADPSTYTGRTGTDREKAFAASKQGQALNGAIGSIAKDLGVSVDFSNDGKGNKLGVGGTIRSGASGKAAEGLKAAHSMLEAKGFVKDKDSASGGTFYTHPQGYSANFRETSRGDVSVAINLPPKAKAKKLDPLGSMGL